MAIRKPIEHTQEVREAFERQFGVDLPSTNGKAANENSSEPPKSK